VEAANLFFMCRYRLHSI